MRPTSGESNPLDTPCADRIGVRSRSGGRCVRAGTPRQGSRGGRWLRKRCVDSVRKLRHDGDELVYRHQLRPVVHTGATVMDRLFDHRDERA
jgi:hypothetical protein